MLDEELLLSWCKPGSAELVLSVAVMVELPPPAAGTTVMEVSVCGDWWLDFVVIAIRVVVSGFLVVVLVVGVDDVWVVVVEGCVCVEDDDDVDELVAEEDEVLVESCVAVVVLELLLLLLVGVMRVLLLP